jgi:hypothetical protein
MNSRAKPIRRNPIPVKFRLVSLMMIALLASCRGSEMEDGGVYITRTACPLVGVPAGTGDITLFDPPNSKAATAIDVTATMTNVFGNCSDINADRILSNVSFDVVAVRREAGPARQVVLPYFDVLVQGGSRVVAKRVGRIALNFEAGSLRAQTRGQAVIRVSRAAATLPENARLALTQRRKAGTDIAAVDPMTDPAVREAVARATFEHLVGFQMSQEQLRYNVTR